MHCYELGIEIPGIGITHITDATQTLTSLKKIKYHRNIEGNIAYIDKQKNKFESTITILNSPIILNMWVGSAVNIYSIETINEIFNKNQTNIFALSRPCIENSINILNEKNNPTEFERLETGEIKITGSYKQAKISYRPILQMIVKDFSCTSSNMGFDSTYKISLEEV